MVDRVTSGPGLILPVAALAAAIAYAAALNPLAALVGLGVTVLLVLALLRPELLLLVFVAVLPWEDSLGYPTETVSVVKLLGALVAGAYLLNALARSTALRWPPTMGYAAALCAVVLLSLLASADPSASVGQALRYLMFATFLFLFVQLVRTPAAMRQCVRVLVLSLAVAATIALIAFLRGEQALAAGPIGDPNDFAYFMATVLPLAIFLLVSDRRWRWLWVACAVVVVAAMLATFSRGAAIGLTAMLVWAVASRKVPLSGALAGLVAAVLVLVAALALWQPLIEERLAAKGNVAQANVDSRQALWSAAGRMAADNPFLGVGPGRFGTEAATYARNEPIGLSEPVTHNSYLEVLAETGIFGLLALALFMAGSWQLARKAVRRPRAAGDEEGRRLGIAVQAGLVVAAVSACFLSVQLTIPIWLLGGLAAVLAVEDG